MPIYEYRCSACGTVFARLQSISAAADSIGCPECGGKETERLVSTFAAGPTTSSAGSSSGGSPGCGGGGG